MQQTRSDILHVVSNRKYAANEARIVYGKLYNE
jgi:hypothetical protein